MNTHVRIAEEAWAERQYQDGIEILARIHAAERLRDQFLEDAAKRLRDARAHLRHARFQARFGNLGIADHWRNEARRALRMARHFKQKASEYELLVS